MKDYSSCNFEKQEIILVKYKSIDYESRTIIYELFGGNGLLY